MVCFVQIGCVGTSRTIIKSGTSMKNRENRAALLSTWRSLRRGETIDLLREGLAPHTGRFDERTRDGQVIWVIGSLGDRRLFHVDDVDICLKPNISDPASGNCPGH